MTIATPQIVLPTYQPGPDDSLDVRLLAEGAQTAMAMATELAAFLERATRSLEIAIYDCRFGEESARIIRDALVGRLQAGVAIRVVYDRGDQKPQSYGELDICGASHATPGTHERVAELGLPDECLRSASGFRALMHHKYIVRDGRDVWTGSMNWTDDSMSRMENIVVRLDSLRLANFFQRDFEQLWRRCRIEASGAFLTDPDKLRFAGSPATVDVDFSPGQGEQINEWVAARLLAARRRIVVCSMLINSSQVLRALENQLDRGRVDMWGVYDRTQMEGVLGQWEQEGRLAWKIDAVRRVVGEAQLIGKDSIPYRPGQSHNFMHNKTVVVDDTVVTGSYNLSHAAEGNAENMLAIESAQLAELIVTYVERLGERFQSSQTGDSGPIGAHN